MSILHRRAINAQRTAEAAQAAAPAPAKKRAAAGKSKPAKKRGAR